MTAQPREHRLTTAEGDICWFEWGESSRGRPSLLLLHATGFHARLWDQLVAHLPAGTHVIAPDHLGHGRSACPATLSDWTKIADALLPLLDRFAGHRLIGCGHSMGGFALTRLAAKRPDAFTHLLLIDPTIFDPAFYPSDIVPPIADLAEHPVTRRRNQWDDASQMIAHFKARPPYAAWVPAVLADYCNFGLVGAAGGAGFELACPPALEASVYHGAMRANPHRWLPLITAPVTVIRAKTGERAGNLDFSVSPTWPELGAAMGAVSDEQWADQSHFIPMEAPQRLAALISAEI